MAKKNSIPTDDLVKELLKDENLDLRNVYNLSGFVGPHEDEDYITLYLDSILHQSIAIKREDIVHSVRLTRTHNPLGGTVIWFKNAVTYLYPEKEKAEDTNSYLEGDIYQPENSDDSSKENEVSETKDTSSK